MRQDPDIVVVGGGVVGLFCAYHLRRAGRSVAVVERGSLGGPQSCSSGNTGFAGTHGATPLAEPGVVAQGLRWLLNPESPFYVKPRLDLELLRWLWHFRQACNAEDAAAGFRVLVEMKQRSLAILREVCAEGSLASTLTARGMVLAFKTPQAFEKACRAVPQAVAYGVPLRVLAASELEELEPDVEFDVSGALYNEEGAYLHLPDFIHQFARLLKEMGVELHSGTEVVGFEVAERRVERVLTDRGDLCPDEVVIAAGAWSAECARKLRIELELQPAKGYSVTVRRPGNAPRLPLLLSEGKVALTPLGDRLRLGGTLELSGMSIAVSRQRVEGILKTVRAFLPRLEPTETVEVWSGLRPCTPDGLPLLGRAEPYRNLSIASGHGHIGMGLAPFGGKLIAQIIAGEEPDVDPAPFRIGRQGRRRPTTARLPAQRRIPWLAQRR